MTEEAGETFAVVEVEVTSEVVEVEATSVEEATAAAVTVEAVEEVVVSEEAVAVMMELIQNSPIPPPDPQITALENNWVQGHGAPVGQLTSALSKLSVAPSDSDSSTAFFPNRPSFGNRGIEVVLWANSFKLSISASSLFKYMLKVTHIPTGEEASKPKKAAGGGNKDAKEAKGRKLTIIIEEALKQLPAGSVVASEFKAQVVSLKKLALPENGTVRVQLNDRNRVETWDVRFNGPESINVQQLMGYLKTLNDPANNTSFPRYPDEIDAIGVVLGHTARADPNAAAVGRSRFFAIDDARADPAKVPEGAISILRGYFQSVRPATGRLLLNTNVTHGIFRRSIGLDELFARMNLDKMDQFHLMAQHMQARCLGELKKMHKYLARSRIRCKVRDEQNQQWHTIDRSIAGLATSKDGKGEQNGNAPQFQPGFQFGGPGNVKFYLRQPTSPSSTAPSTPGLSYNSFVTVAHYYTTKYGISVKMGMPLINVGSPGKPVYVLAEHCTVIPGQPLKTKLTPKEQDSMIQFACRPPPSNAVSITTSARAVLALDNNPLLNRFGIAIDKELVTVKARELAPPLLTYRNSAETVRPDNGGWLMKNVKVAKAGRPINSWTFLYMYSQNNATAAVKEAAGKFAKFMANSMGINIPREAKPPNGVTTQLPSPNSEAEVEAAFKKLANLQPRPELVLVVLPEKNTVLYNTVKKLADINHGIHTVCVVQEKILQEKGQLGYFANVSLKVNLKFGGVNHKVNDDVGLFKSGKTMVVGYDVTHPTNLAPGAGDDAPSMVGLVASVDSDLAQWPAVAWNNPSRVEMLDVTLDKEFQGRLRLWQAKNQNRLPENIIIYRDGVSEGQFATVLKEELPHIRAACTAVYKARSPPRISLIVSVKRHQTRFYPTDPAHIHQRSKSPKEGTVVDRGVTNVRYWDFFLQAHASLQGTARPAHYTVLLDEIFRADFGSEAANVLEKLTHEMCYLYGRATKAVSICPPAYYADLVCTRARIHKEELFSDTESVSTAAALTVGQRSVHPNLKDSMYYI
ncbi:ribonuclease H-like domain-containing protein [Podospora appendiculata]|uniref:Ribonuclease H-like domain-containing protein n=1 Tax=Podospora appendiculata TaxID=314037 RepID=A0AAE0X175_9PEZI|nr:ribonuclease H-like domain-containing protein [Podospora appendiculata]